MPEPTKPTSYGPDRIRIKPTTTGAAIVTTAHDRNTVRTILDLLLDEYADDFDTVAAGLTAPAGHPTGLMPYERLVEQLMGRLPGDAPLHGPEVAAVAKELNDIAKPKGLPSQREAGAA